MQLASAEIREFAFDSSRSSPGEWLLQARQLRAAAQRLDWIDAKPEAMLSMAFPTEYRFLIALSVENLIKGILVAERMRRQDSAPLAGIMNHYLDKLAEQINSLPTPLSPDELDVLRVLTEYVIWAGRYPFPKESPAYRLRGHSGAERVQELALWDRLAEHLRSIGWLSKGHPECYGWYWLFT